MRQRNRIIVMSLALVAVVAIRIGAPTIVQKFHPAQQERTKRPNPHPASRAEQREILHALLKSYAYEGIPAPPPEPNAAPVIRKTPPVVLLDSTVKFCADTAVDVSQDPSCEGYGLPELISAHEIDAKIPIQLRHELILANQTLSVMADPKIENVIFESRRSVMTLFANGGWWDDFYAKFPGTSGKLQVSQAVISNDGSHALIYASHQCDGTCGTGMLHYFRRTGQTWALVASVHLWIS
jgi:hypothetical protein